MTCKATNRQGEPCGQPAIQGGTVCRYHGGAAPQVQQAAARRVLEALVAPALIQLRDILEQEDTPSHVRLAAIRDILDRTGHSKPKQIEIITIDIIEAEILRLETELDLQPDEPVDA